MIVVVLLLLLSLLLLLLLLRLIVGGPGGGDSKVEGRLGTTARRARDLRHYTYLHDTFQRASEQESELRPPVR